MKLRRSIAIAIAAVVLFAGGACSDDDDDALSSGTAATRADDASAAQSSDEPTTTREPLDPDDPACKEVQIVLKPDVTDDQRAAIEEKLESLDEVSEWRYDSGTGGGGKTYWVVPESVDAQGPIGEEFAMDGVTSVIFPNQVC